MQLMAPTGKAGTTEITLAVQPSHFEQNCNQKLQMTRKLYYKEQVICNNEFIVCPKKRGRGDLSSPLLTCPVVKRYSDFLSSGSGDAIIKTGVPSTGDDLDCSLIMNEARNRIY